MAWDYVTHMGTPKEMKEFHSPTESKARNKIIDWLEIQEKREQRFSAENAAKIAAAKIDFDSTVFDPLYPIDVTLEMHPFNLRFRLEARTAKAGPKGGRR